MTTRYRIPEAIIGAVGLGLAAWILPITISINNTIASEVFRNAFDTQSMDFYILQLNSVLCFLAGIAFLMVGLYFSWIVCEDVVVFFWKKYKKQGKQQTEWCKTTYCSDCPDSDTCPESKK